MRTRLRSAAQSVAPRLMADRARAYEREFRIRHGITALGKRLVSSSDSTVRGGAFAGLVYPPNGFADVDAPVAKLVGCYEQEIAYVFADALRDGVEVFVDVGCADGYYAVGMAMRSPRLATYAYDLSRSALRKCASVAELNDVTDRVRLAGRCNPEALAGLPLEGALLLCDIEGGEADFFDERTVGLLRHTRVVVEAHDGGGRELGSAVALAFGDTHECRALRPQRREPDDPRLASWTPSDLDAALSEGRRPGDHWLDLVPRD